MYKCAPAIIYPTYSESQEAKSSQIVLKRRFIKPESYVGGLHCGFQATGYSENFMKGCK